MKGAAICAAVLVVACHCGTAFAQADAAGLKGPPSADAVIAFVNVNVVSMERDGVDPSRTVTVRGGRIVSIDTSTPQARPGAGCAPNSRARTDDSARGCSSPPCSLEALPRLSSAD